MPPLGFPAVFPMLRAGAMTLRELGEHDIPAWFARATDADAADLAGDPVPDSIEMGTPWLQRQKGLFLRQDGIRWAIVPSHAIESVGTIGLTLSPRDRQTAELGIVVARRYWGRGFGTSAARMVIQYGLTELALTEINAKVLQRNPASIRLLEKAGLEMVRVLPPDEVEPEVMILYALSQRTTSAA